MITFFPNGGKCQTKTNKSFKPKGVIYFFVNLEYDHIKADMLSEDWNVKWSTVGMSHRPCVCVCVCVTRQLWHRTGVLLGIEQSLLLPSQPNITAVYPANHIQTLVNR